MLILFFLVLMEKNKWWRPQWWFGWFYSRRGESDYKHKILLEHCIMYLSENNKQKSTKNILLKDFILWIISPHALTAVDEEWDDITLFDFMKWFEKKNPMKWEQ